MLAGNAREQQIILLFKRTNQDRFQFRDDCNGFIAASAFDVSNANKGNRIHSFLLFQFFFYSVSERKIKIESKWNGFRFR